MWRYYLVSTAIVVVLGGIVFSFHRAAPPPAPWPTPVPTFGGAGPWAMSALPDCFTQQRAIVGPSARLARDLPPDRDRVRPGTVFHAGACTVSVGADALSIARGRDRLRVPPDARLYRSGARLILVWRGAGRTEIRVY